MPAYLDFGSFTIDRQGIECRITFTAANDLTGIAEARGTGTVRLRARAPGLGIVECASTKQQSLTEVGLSHVVVEARGGVCRVDSHLKEL